MKTSLLGNISDEFLRTTQFDCVVVGVEGSTLNDVANQINDLCSGLLQDVLESKDLGDKAGDTVLLRTGKTLGSRQIMLVQLGVLEEMDAARQLKIIGAAAKALKATRCGRLLWGLTQSLGRESAISQSIHAVTEAAYRFDSFKSESNPAVVALDEVALLVAPEQVVPRAQVLRQAYALSQGVSLCRDLGNLPPNRCTPTYLAEVAEQLAQSVAAKTSVEVLEREDIQALGMNSFLCVARGSVQPPKLIVLQRKAGPQDQAPLVLVGKGITFDSGGISIKPGQAMDEMKYDMCGAASVLGTFKAIIEMDLPLNVVGIIPTCENMPSGEALKPGDIITSMAGKSIEVLNTDAEGRLILCDALTYAERFEPAAVVDIATLTGACVIALGNVHSGLFAREDALAAELIAAAQASGDTVWRMPLDSAYNDSLKSNFADLANIGGREAGSITAACFLENFTRKYPWAHLDIAGTAWRSGAEKGATGRPVKLLTEYLVARCTTAL
ncbi:MAG: leucyl aminopeptidase [Janthinobacterium lividum]